MLEFTPSVKKGIISKLHGDNSHPGFLTTSIKVLAKILANQLLKIITNFFCPDQSVFIPNRSTPINIRHLYLNLYIPCDEKGDSVVLYLDK